MIKKELTRILKEQIENGEMVIRWGYQEPKGPFDDEELRKLYVEEMKECRIFLRELEEKDPDWLQEEFKASVKQLRFPPSILSFVDHVPPMLAKYAHKIPVETRNEFFYNLVTVVTGDKGCKRMDAPSTCLECQKRRRMYWKCVEEDHCETCSMRLGQIQFK